MTASGKKTAPQAALPRRSGLSPVVAHPHGPTLFITVAVDISSIDAAELIIRPKEVFFHASSRAVGRTPEDGPRGVAARDSLRSQQAPDDVRNVFRRELRFPRGLTRAEDNTSYFIRLQEER